MRDVDWISSFFCFMGAIAAFHGTSTVCCTGNWGSVMGSIKHESKPVASSSPLAQRVVAVKKRLHWKILLPKLTLGFCNAIFGLVLAVAFFSYGDEKIVPIAALHSKCRSFSDSHSVPAERPSLYAFCIGQGIHFSPNRALAQLR
jgi:hypothetical protein